MTALASGDVFGPIATAIQPLVADVPLAVAAGVGLAVISYGARRLWGVFKGFK